MINRKFLNINLLIDLENYIKSLRNWEEVFQATIPVASRESFFNEQFDKYVEIVKPIIYENSMIKDLKKVPNIALYTNQLNENQVERITKAIGDLKHWEIVVGEPENRIDSIQLLAEPTIKRPPLTKVQLHSKPKNYEVDLWGTTLQIQPVTIRGPVIHSKKVASNSLGMPTANFKIDQMLSKALIPYPNGIYAGTFKFSKDPDLEYRAVCSLGINMHYENQVWSRKFEAYVCHQFDQQFYGEDAEVELKRLIRLEGLFKSFDSFLNAMSNDIWVGKHLQL